MFLKDAVAIFKKERKPSDLQFILDNHGSKGFSIACKAAGISRGAGKRMLGSYQDDGAIKQVASNACGLKTSTWI
jgi:methyl coenzyme M reductase beta subunit